MRAPRSSARSSVDPGHAAANTQLGILLREDGKFAEAERRIAARSRRIPSHALAHYNLGVLLDIYLRRTAEALEHYEAYQASLTEPNETVGRWIIDLRRRVGNGERRASRAGGRPMKIAIDGCAAARRGESPSAQAERAAPERRAPLANVDDLEPAVDVGAAARRARSARQRRSAAAARGGAAASGAAPASRDRRKPTDRPAPRVMDSLDLGTTSITGNAELPKVLYIVPWKKSDLGRLGRAPRQHIARRGARARRSRGLRTASELLRFPVRGARRGVRDGGL